MRVKANALGVIVLIVIFGGIIGTSILNVWNTTSTKVPVSFQTGDFEGEYNPADIRGSYTFDDINNAFEIPEDILGKAFGVENYQNLAEFQVKNLETIYENLKDRGTEIGTGSVRLFVGLYKGLPIELSEDNYLLKPGVDILVQRGNLSEEQLQFVKTNVVDLINIPVEEISPNLNDEADEHLEDEKVVKGKTTFYEVISWGVSEGAIEDLIGEKIPAPGMTISDYCRNNGIDFSQIKDTLNGMIQK